MARVLTVLFLFSTLNLFANGSAELSNPVSATTDGTNLYVIDASTNVIKKVVIATGQMTELTSSKVEFSTYNGDRLNHPKSITADDTNLYVADTGNNVIRKVSIATGQVTTLAGSRFSAQGNKDGVGEEARFNRPEGITTDGTNLYVTDAGNHSIRKIVIATGEVTTIFVSR